MNNHIRWRDLARVREILRVRAFDCLLDRPIVSILEYSVAAMGQAIFVFDCHQNSPIVIHKMDALNANVMTLIEVGDKRLECIVSTIS